MPVNVKILIERMSERQKQLPTAGVCALVLAEAEIGIYHLLYAADVGVSDGLLVFEHGVKAVYALLESGKGAIGEIHTMVLQICSYEHHSVGCRLEMVLIGMKPNLKVGLQIKAKVFYHLTEQTFGSTYNDKIVNKTCVIYGQIVRLHPCDDIIIKVREEEVGEYLRGEIADRHTVIIIVAEQRLVSFHVLRPFRRVGIEHT